MVLLGFILFQYERNRAVGELQRNALQSSDRLSNALSYPLWNFNKEEVGKSLALEMYDPNITAIVLTDKDLREARFYAGKKKDTMNHIVSFEPDSTELKDLEKSSFYVVKGTVTINTEEIGKVALYYTDTHINDNLFSLIFKLIGLVTILSAASVVVLFWGIRVIILSPLLELARAVKEVGDNNQFSTTVPVTSSDEIGMLATTFNQMTSSLKDFYGNLEQKVAERTEQLAAAQEGLKKKIADLAELNGYMVNRELKMVQLKEEIARLKGEEVPKSETKIEPSSEV